MERKSSRITPMSNTHNPSLYIKESLLQNNNTAYSIWKGYKQSTGSHIGFQSFLKYIGILKRLKLIEATETKASGLGRGNMPAPHKATILSIKVTDSDDWINPYKAIYKNKYREAKFT